MTNVKLSDVTVKKEAFLECDNWIILTIQQGISVQDQVDFAKYLDDLNVLSEKTPEIAFKYIKDRNIEDDEWNKVPLSLEIFLQLKISFEKINEILRLCWLRDFFGAKEKKNIGEKSWVEVEQPSEATGT